MLVVEIPNFYYLHRSIKLKPASTGVFLLDSFEKKTQQGVNHPKCLKSNILLCWSKDIIGYQYLVSILYKVVGMLIDNFMSADWAIQLAGKEYANGSH